MSQSDEISGPPPSMASYVSLPGFGAPRDGGTAQEFATTSGAFVLQHMIARGGQGEVWEAWQTSLGREVAVKIHHHGDDEAFLAEARLTGQLDHPNIVPVLDLGAVTAGPDAKTALVMAMKRVRGQRWDELVAQERPADGTLPHDYLARHLGILSAVCHAVAYAHSHGVLHLDLKPTQVIVGAYGEVYLMDWGMAACMERQTALPHVRCVDDVEGPVGTPAFMAPEQALGDSEAMGPATDVYLLGGLAYYVVAGHAPHPGATIPDVLASARRNAIIPLPTSAPHELRALVDQALAFAPGERLASVQAFRTAVEQVITHVGLHREAQELLATVRERMAAPAPLDYADLVDLERSAARARGMAPYLDEAEHLRDTVLQRHAQLACQRGDLELAGLLAQSIDHETSRDTTMATVNAAIAERDHQRLQRRRAQRMAVGSMALVLLVLAIAVPLLMSAYRRVDRERTYTATALGLAQRELYRASIQAAFSLAEKYKYADARRSLAEAPAALRGWEWGFLMAMAQPEQVLYAPRDERFTAMAVDTASSAPTVAALRQRDGAAVVFAADSGTTLSVLPPASADDRWQAVAAMPGGGYILGSQRGVLCTIHTQAPWRSASLGSGIVLLAAGPGLVAVDEAGRAWRVAPGEKHIIFERPGDAVTAAAFNPDGRWLALGTQRGRIAWQAWGQADWYEGTESHNAAVSRITWHPKREMFATAAAEWPGDMPNADLSTRVWTTNSTSPQQRLTSPEGRATDALYSADGSALITADSHALVERYSSPNGVRLGSTEEGTGIIRRIRLSADGRRMITVTRNHVTIRGPETLAPFREFEPDAVRVKDIAAVPSMVVAMGESGGLAGWRIDAPEHSHIISSWPHPFVSLDAVRSTPLIATAQVPGVVRYWNATQPQAEGKDVTWHEGPLVAVRTSHDGSVVATLKRDGLLRVQRLTPAVAPAIEFSTGPTAVALALSADGETAAVVTSDGILYRCDTASRTRTELRRTEPREHWQSITFTPDGTGLFAGRATGPIDWVRVTDSKTQGVCTGHTGPTNRLECTGKYLVSAGEDETARLWEMASCNEVAVLRGSHAGGVTAAAMTPDGRRVITASRDWGVRVFDVATQAELLVMQWHKYGVLDLTLSSDGRTLYTVGVDANMRWWRALPW